MPPPAGLLDRLRPTKATTTQTPGTSAALITHPTKTPQFTDEQLLKIAKDFKKECFADRWIWERQWTRNLHYVNGRQWLAPYSRTDGWRDARIAKGIPRPVTQYAKIGVQSIRAMFTTTSLGVTVRPTSQDPKSVVTASTCDDLLPILHDLHKMDQVLNEGDFWFIVLGNVCLHTYWDPLAGAPQDIPFEQCLQCGQEFRQDEIAKSGGQCPACQWQKFGPAFEQDGETPKVHREYEGGPVTVALSPLEVAFPLHYPRWTDVPGVIRMRFRDKAYYENHPELQEQMAGFPYQKSSSERSMQIFQSLPYQNDLAGQRLGAFSYGTTGTESEGAPEYEISMKPSPTYPDGLVFRVVGDSNPKILRLPSESLPGPLPYKDVKGRPLFTYAWEVYEHVGGRVIGSGALDPVIAKFDQLNRLDSIVEMIMTRMASPQWSVPKGSEPLWLADSPGQPGLIINYDPMAPGGGKPEKIPGAEPGRAFAQIREQLVKDIEDGMGTYDALRGMKPPGVEAFSAMQLMVERGEARFACALGARIDGYAEWAGWALELERTFGPKSRTYAVMTPTRGWALRTFQQADLAGDITIIKDEGSQKPKTILGQRANVEHLNQLRYLDPTDSDQKYAVFQKFGALDLLPGLDSNTQAALRKQEAFERWMEAGGPKQLRQAIDPATGLPGPDPTDPTYPLRWRAWYDPIVHRQRLILWANSDDGVQLFAKYPDAEGLITAHLLECDLALQQKQSGIMDPQASQDPSLIAPPQPGGNPGQPPEPPGTPPTLPGPGGASMAMANSQQNSGAVHSLPGGPAMTGAQAPV